MWVVLRPGVSPGHIAAEECSQFYNIAAKRPPLPAARFNAAALDFANVARGEDTGDVLLAYEL